MMVFLTTTKGNFGSLFSWFMIIALQEEPLLSACGISFAFITKGIVEDILAFGCVDTPIVITLVYRPC